MSKLLTVGYCIALAYQGVFYQTLRLTATGKTEPVGHIICVRG